MPKTDYTYARSGSYCREALDKPYVSPNMSRRRLHRNVTLSPEARGIYSNSATNIVENETTTTTTTYSTIQTSNNSYNIGSSYLETNNRLSENLNNSYSERMNNSRNETDNYLLNSNETEVIDEYSDEESDIVDDDASSSSRRRYIETEDGMVLRSGSHLHGIKATIDSMDQHSKRQSDIIPSSSSRKIYNRSNNMNTEYITTSSTDSVNSSTQLQSLKRRLDYEDTELEKAAYETSEKSQNRRSPRNNNVGSYSSNSSLTTKSSVDHMYGLDSDDESDVHDGNTVSSGSSTWSTDTANETITETVITTITTIYTYFTYMTEPLYGPIVKVLGPPVRTSYEWLWRKFTTFMAYFVLLDFWILRRRQFCCICVPLLLLLLPLLLFGGYYGKQMLAKSNILPLFWVQRGTTEQVVINKVSQFDTYNLNDKVKQIVLQLQGNQAPSLSQADIEVIIRGILEKELNSLRLDLVGQINQAKADQSVEKKQYNQKLASLETLLSAAEVRASDLEKDLSQAKLYANMEGDQVNAQSLLRIQRMEDQLREMNIDIGTLRQSHIDMTVAAQNCCKNDSFYTLAVRDEVKSILAGIMSGSDGNQGGGGDDVSSMFMSWLHGNYISKEEFEVKMKALANDITEKILLLEQNTAQQIIIQSENSQDTSGGIGGISETYVRSLVEESLLKFSADKTGMADYALESAGGSVLSTRCSETYYPKTALVSIFGIPMYYSSNSPRTVLQPDVNPGECWPFKGNKGYIVIQLVRPITPTGFTLEHIPKLLSNTGDIKSAPKDFAVYGLENESSDAAILLGNYTYNDNGPSVQFFPVKRPNPSVYRLVELRILDNYGHLEFTCIYRFRVHGNPVSI
ncbi:SUN domain-containing protein 1 isoform X2 [Patella vulgata]|nr:SUN domain-containing protein 1 isoform X2 [Patella vulgata]